MEYQHSQHGGLSSSSRQNHSPAKSRTIPSSSLPRPNDTLIARRIGLSRPAAYIASQTRDKDRTNTQDRVQENRKDGVMKESKGHEENIPPATPPKPNGQRLPKAMMKLVSDKQATRLASLAESQSTADDAELPSASLQSIPTAAGSSPPTSPKKSSTSRRKLDEGTNRNPPSRLEGNGGKTGRGAKKRKSRLSKSKGQKQTTERTPSADQLASAFFDEIAGPDPTSRPVSPLSPLKTAQSSQAMPDDEAEAYFEGLKLETQQQASQLSKREKEAEKRRLQKEEQDRKWAEEMDHVKSEYFMDIKRDGQRDREFTKAINLASSQTTPALESPSFSPRKRLRPESEVERSLICQFCSGNLDPGFADPEFHRLRFRLDAIASTPVNPDYSFSRELDWSKRIDFCSWHEAIMGAIPAGKAAGYPDEIDFLSIPERLEEEWIRKELEGLTKYPLRSKKWQEYSNMIDEAGRSKWKITQLREPHIVLSQHVGYYGVTGRAVIGAHLRNLVKWGYLPALSRISGEISLYEPMTNEEFIEHILIPEAGILLIMDDLGLDIQSRSGKEKAEMRAQAENVWKESREYGRWQFKESKRSEKIEARVRQRSGEIKEIVMRMREQSKRSRKKQMDSSMSSRRGHKKPIAKGDSDDDRLEAVKREPIELKRSSPTKRSRDRMKTYRQPMSKNGDSDGSIDVVMLVDSTAPQLESSLSNTQRSFAKTESFNSGYGDDVFEGMDYSEFDEVCRANVIVA